MFGDMVRTFLRGNRKLPYYANSFLAFNKRVGFGKGDSSETFLFFDLLQQ